MPVSSIPPVPTVESAVADPVVTLDSVTVSYGKSPALRDVTASFAAGAVGLLGPNGAGKSTMIKALLGFIVPERGRMRVLGLDVALSPLEIRARVGYVPESDAHIPGMNAVGMNTADSTRAIPTTGPEISSMAFKAASFGAIPSSM